ncbi:hypothetical protein FJTKL_11847 [Diaporthe vaccinii]|uniref:Uncharacterized protein n=1 Tax=Diaporthe vaccinii TaxID=105482 RepID=A0ABR4FA71_9PEZI
MRDSGCRGRITKTNLNFGICHVDIDCVNATTRACLFSVCRPHLHPPVSPENPKSLSSGHRHCCDQQAHVHTDLDEAV